MNDLERVRELVLRLTADLGHLDIGEILLTYHVVSQSARILMENNDTEAIGLLRAYQQSVFDEIAARIYRKEIDISDAAEFHEKMMEKYHQLKDSPNFKEIETSLNDLSGNSIDFKKDIEKMSLDFTKEYNQIFGVKPKRKRKVPSPNQIITGRQIPGLPNN